MCWKPRGNSSQFSATYAAARTESETDRADRLLPREDHPAANRCLTDRRGHRRVRTNSAPRPREGHGCTDGLAQQHPARTNGIGDVTTMAAAAIARSRISTAYWRETLRASGPSRKLRETVTPKKCPGASGGGRGATNGHERDEAKHRAHASRLLEFACCQFRRDRSHGVGDHSRREPGRLSLGRQLSQALNQRWPRLSRRTRSRSIQDDRSVPAAELSHPSSDSTR